MGLVGPGFVGAHHIDAVQAARVRRRRRRSPRAPRRRRRRRPTRSACRRRTAATRRWPPIPTCTSSTTRRRTICTRRSSSPRSPHRKHVVSRQAAGDDAPPKRAGCCDAATRAGVVHAVTFNYRGNPLVQQARAMIAAGELGPLHFVHGTYLQDWLLEPTDFSWRLEPDKGGESSAIGDIGSHWCDLVAARHRAAHRRGARRPDDRRRDAAQAGRRRPKRSRRAGGSRARAGGDHERGPGARCCVRFDGGAKGCVTVGQVCAGHKNDLWFEVNGGGRRCAGLQERQNELWIGRRRRGEHHAAEGSVAARRRGAPATRICRAATRKGWTDAFRNVMRDIYALDRRRQAALGRRRPPAFPTFEDGYRAACLVDAILESHRRGGVWTTVNTGMKLGLFTPVFGKLNTDDMLAKVQALEKVQAIELGTGGWPGRRSPRRRRAARRQGVRRRVPADDRRRRPDDQRAVVPRQPAASRRRDRREADDDVFRKTVRLAEQMGVPVVVTFSGCPGDSDDAQASELGHDALAAGVSRGARLAVGEEGDSVLDRRREVRRGSRREGGARGASGLCRLQRRQRAEAARAPRDRTSASTSTRAISSGRASTCPPRSARSAIRSSTCTRRTSRSIRSNVAVNGVIDTKSYRRMTERSWLFRSVGWGHDELEWKRIVSALRLAGYDYVMSIEHEDALASVDEGLRRGDRSAVARGSHRTACRRLVDVAA